MLTAATGCRCTVLIARSMALQHSGDAAGMLAAAARRRRPGCPVLDLPGHLCAGEELVALIEGASPHAHALIDVQAEPLPYPADTTGSALAELVALLPEISPQERVRDTVQRFADLVKRGLLSPPGD
jgi:hypothetical protein